MTQTKQENKKTVQFRPLGNRVLLKRLEAEEVTKGGILLPDSAKKKQEEAEVIAVGPGKKDKDGNLVAPSVQPGDIVIMQKYAGQEVTLDDVEYVIVKADDLIAIIEK